MDVGEQAPPNTPEIQWCASWGDQIKEGDLVKVIKLGGPVRVLTMRRFNHNHPRPVVVDDTDDGHWYYGCIVQDKTGQQFHIFVQPHEPLFLALEVPETIGPAEGVAPDGEIGS